MSEASRRACNSVTVSSYHELKFERKKVHLDVYMSVASRRVCNSVTASSCSDLKFKIRLDV